MMPRDRDERLSARIVYTGPVPAPVSKGQPIGTLKVWRGDNLALEVPLKAAEDVGKGSMSQRAMDGATELMIGLFRAGVGRLDGAWPYGPLPGTWVFFDGTTPILSQLTQRLQSIAPKALIAMDQLVKSK